MNYELRITKCELFKLESVTRNTKHETRNTKHKTIKQYNHGIQS